MSVDQVVEGPLGVEHHRVQAPGQSPATSTGAFVSASIPSAPASRRAGSTVRTHTGGPRRAARRRWRPNRGLADATRTADHHDALVPSRVEHAGHARRLGILNPCEERVGERVDLVGPTPARSKRGSGSCGSGSWPRAAPSRLPRRAGVRAGSVGRSRPPPRAGPASFRLRHRAAGSARGCRVPRTGCAFTTTGERDAGPVLHRVGRLDGLVDRHLLGQGDEHDAAPGRVAQHLGDLLRHCAGPGRPSRRRAGRRAT